MLGDNKSEVFSFAAVDESDVDEAFIDVGVVSEDLDQVVAEPGRFVLHDVFNDLVAEFNFFEAEALIAQIDFELKELVGDVGCKDGVGFCILFFDA